MGERLVQVSGADFRRLWPSIVGKVRQIYEQETAPGYLVEDIYAEVIKDDVLFFHCDDGFVICNTHRNPYNNGRSLNVWMAASYNVEHGVIIKHKNEINDIARHYGCEHVTFRTTRPGFQRICSAHGMELVEYLYAWRVGHVEERQ